MQPVDYTATVNTKYKQTANLKQIDTTGSHRGGRILHWSGTCTGFSTHGQERGRKQTHALLFIYLFMQWCLPLKLFLFNFTRLR